ncbi:MAG: hypothetical protein ACFCUI_02020 [Bernardetiaceae bacterium]
MTPEDLKVIQERFTLKHEDEVSRIYTGNDSNVIICQMLQSYTEIDNFKAMLYKKAELIEQYGCDLFVFDKRSIRGFHQPSMEWYYLEWKPEMYRRFGLRVHRKLFTTETWFLKCIEAGRAEIKRRDPGSIVHTMDITIVDTIAQAIDPKFAGRKYG